MQGSGGFCWCCIGLICCLSPCRRLRLTEVIVERAASAKELDLHQQAMAKEASRPEVGAANITLGLGLRICALGR